MANLENQRKREEVEINKTSSLRGAFASVLIMGLVIVGMWVGVFLLYIVRN